MKPSHLTSLWTTLSAFLAYYAINSVIVMQGGKAILDAKLVLEGRAPAAVVGIAVCGFVLFVTALIGRVYATRAEGSWHARVPVVGLKDLATASFEGRIYQIASLIIFVLLPVVSIVLFWVAMLTATFTLYGQVDQPVGPWDWSVLGAHGLNNPAQICTTDECAKEGRATYLPGLEPTVLLLLTLAAFSMVIAQMRVVFRRWSQAGRSASTM